MTWLDPPTLTSVVLLLVILLTVGMTSAWVVLDIRRARLPAATLLEDVEGRLAAKQEELERRRGELREIEQRIADRDRLAAEAAALRNDIEELKAQQEALGSARAEIAQTQEEAEKAAAELAEVKQKLAAAEARLEEVERVADPGRLAGLQGELARLQAERDRLASEIDPLRAERDAALRVIAEAREAAARVGALTEMGESLRAAQEDARKALAEAEERLAEARAERLEALKDRDRARVEADEARTEAERARRDAAELRAELRALESRIDALREEIPDLVAGLRARSRGGPQAAEERKELLEDLIAPPACLAAPSSFRSAPLEEHRALHELSTQLQKDNLKFGDRVVRAFHTALKVNDTAQITVLAGVSGTGKSLLPRRYAQAMGMAFLQVAVEPRWDSPQDLLGFYNYVEGRYRATELARLMAAMDPWESFGPEGNRRDRVAMVLLDEMNLARVEYYFSEFLSRLEVRPPWDGQWPAREACKDALIPLDIRGLQTPVSLYPGQNILFVGTMNDDESTQSLSEKVLDRGNVLQFPAPATFASAARRRESAAPALRFDSWRRWIRPPTALEGAEEPRVAEVVGQLAKIMEDFGKPFGHRMNLSIRHYVANYPVEGARDARIPLADQVEFRILPRLRGVEIASFAAEFDQLEDLIRKRLGDSELADRLRQLREDQERRSGQFVWRGLARG